MGVRDNVLSVQHGEAGAPEGEAGGLLMALKVPIATTDGFDFATTSTRVAWPVNVATSNHTVPSDLLSQRRMLGPMIRGVVRGDRASASHGTLLDVGRRALNPIFDDSRHCDQTDRFRGGPRLRGERATRGADIV